MTNKKQNYKWDKEINKLCKDNGIKRIKSMSLHYFKSLLKLAMNIGYEQGKYEQSLYLKSKNEESK